MVRPVSQQHSFEGSQRGIPQVRSCPVDLSSLFVLGGNDLGGSEDAHGAAPGVTDGGGAEEHKVVDGGGADAEVRLLRPIPEHESLQIRHDYDVTTTLAPV